MTIVEEVASPGTRFANPHPGHCRVCDRDLKELGLNPNRQYCDDHRPEQSGKKPPQGGRKRGERVTPEQVRDSTPAETVRSIGQDIRESRLPKKPTVDATTKVLGKVIYYLFLAVVMSIVGSDPTLTDQEQEEVSGGLALSAEDADAIARPFSRMLTPTDFWQKAGPKVIENSDIVDAIVAAYNAASGVIRYQRERKRRTMMITAGNPSMNGHVPIQPPPSRFQQPTDPDSVPVPVHDGMAMTVPESWGVLADARTIAEIRRRHGQPAPGEEA